MTNESYLDTFRNLDPVATETLAVLDASPERDRTYASILARRTEVVLRKEPTRLRDRQLGRLVLALACALALTLPALAFADEMRSLFGFSTEGTAIDESKFGLSSAGRIVDQAEAEGTVELIASRADTHFYVARGKNGVFCFFVGPPDVSDLRLSGGCSNMRLVRVGSAEPSGPFATFPSPELPVLDLSSHRSLASPDALRSGEATVLGSPTAIVRLRGVAADGVARMQVIGPECEVVAEAVVRDNVYATEQLPARPAVAIVGLDHGGNKVFDSKLRQWQTSPCAAMTGGR